MNEVEIAPAVAAELVRLFGPDSAAAATGDEVYVWGIYDGPAQDNRLVFENDEGVDYLGNTDGLLEAMHRLGCRGRICFGDVEASGGPSFWGYELTDAGVTSLSGRIHWSRGVTR